MKLKEQFDLIVSLTEKCKKYEKFIKENYDINSIYGDYCLLLHNYFIYRTKLDELQQKKES